MTERHAQGNPVTATLIVSVVAPLGLSLIAHAALPQWHWADQPVHAVVESLGGFIALTLAAIIVMLRLHERLGPRFTWIAIGLTAMGILDAFHAALYAGRAFVWLHSLAVFLGGLTFAGVWLPRSVSAAALPKGPTLAAITAVLLGAIAVIWPEQVPPMVNASGFTAVARLINLLGGIGFIAAGVHFIRFASRPRSAECAIFASHCLLLGVASLLFEFSVLWDATWWLWHMLRLSAYAVVLYYFLSAYNRMQDALRDNESVLANAQRLARLGHWHWDAATERFEASPVVCEILGTHPERVNTTLDDYLAHVVSEDRGALEHALYDCLTTQSAFRLDHRIGRSADDIRDVYIQGESAMDTHGRIVGVRGIIQEVTERKRKDAQLRLAGAIYTTTTEAILVTGPDGVITDINPAFLTMTGYARDHVVGQNIGTLGATGHDYVPLDSVFNRLAQRGSWRGEIALRRIDGSIVPLMASLTTLHDPDGRVTSRICLMSDISELKAKQQRIWAMANLDALTDLPNRNLFYDRIEVCLANARRVNGQAALLYIDLDGFKAVNDRHGHSLGDALLQQAAMRMKQCLRESDTLARLGGDEFTVILPDIHRLEDATAVACKILEAVASPFELQGQEIQITTSIGVACFPDDASETDELIRQADDAMYRAKGEGRNTVRCADPALAFQYPASPTSQRQTSLF